MADRTYRPRLSREERDALLDAASTLNGAEVSTFPEAVRKVARWLDAITDNVDECPDCGTEYIADNCRQEGLRPVDLPEGKWWCHRCRAAFSAWDYVGVDNVREARFPGLRDDFEYRFEYDSDEAGAETDTIQSGTIDSLGRQRDRYP